MSAARKRIAELFAHLERASDNSSQASQFLRNAVLAAEEGERRHRKMGRGLSGGYRESVETAARYFALKWALEGSRPHATPKSWVSAAIRRLDFVNGMALGETLKSEGKAGVAFPDPKAIEALDYTTDVVGPS